MKIALIGYGKMNKLVEQIALQNSHQIVAIIDPEKGILHITKKDLNEADICIDFSTPSCFIENLTALAALNQTIVVGTTGWYNEIDRVKELVERYKIGFLYAPNFSLGVNIFYKIVKEAARMINFFDDYDPSGFEIHHNQKKDSPSGTAKALSEILVNEIDRKKEIFYDKIDRQVLPEELHFASIRGGSNPGQHTIIFDSHADTITLTHQARSREGFAKGAIRAAEWLYGKKGFYTIQDLIEETFHA